MVIQTVVIRVDRVHGQLHHVAGHRVQIVRDFDLVAACTRHQQAVDRVSGGRCRRNLIITLIPFVGDRRIARDCYAEGGASAIVAGERNRLRDDLHRQLHRQVGAAAEHKGRVIAHPDGIIRNVLIRDIADRQGGAGRPLNVPPVLLPLVVQIVAAGGDDEGRGLSFRHSDIVGVVGYGRQVETIIHGDHEVLRGDIPVHIRGRQNDGTRRGVLEAFQHEVGAHNAGRHIGRLAVGHEVVNQHRERRDRVDLHHLRVVHRARGRRGIDRPALSASQAAQRIKRLERRASRRLELHRVFLPWQVDDALNRRGHTAARHTSEGGEAIVGHGVQLRVVIQIEEEVMRGAVDPAPLGHRNRAGPIGNARLVDRRCFAGHLRELVRALRRQRLVTTALHHEAWRDPVEGRPDVVVRRVWVVRIGHEVRVGLRCQRGLQDDVDVSHRRVHAHGSLSIQFTKQHGQRNADAAQRHGSSVHIDRLLRCRWWT